MTQNIHLKYGEQVIDFSIDEKHNVQFLEYEEIESIADVASAFEDAIDHPVASQSFNDLFKAGDKVTIVVSDITRLWVKVDLFLPLIIERLNQLGVKDEDMIILISTGTHRGSTVAERVRLLGQDIVDRIEILDHDCDHSEMVYLGTSSRGTEVEFNRLIVERKTILTGGIVHHIMAGFGGGRKSVLPGVSSRKTINQNHSHTLDPNEKQSNPLIGAGRLAGNPLHLDMVECTAMADPIFLVNVVVDPKGKLAKFVAGHWLKAWEEGCRWTDEKFGVPIDHLADVVVASCGGFPKDISLYQTGKTLFNAILAVKEGGTLILMSQCSEGAGEDSFFGWSKNLLEGTLDGDLRTGFTIPGYIFYAFVEAAKKAKVILVSEIAQELVAPMNIRSVATIEEAWALADIDQEEQHIMVMAYGGNTVPLYNG